MSRSLSLFSFLFLVSSAGVDAQGLTKSLTVHAAEAAAWKNYYSAGHEDHHYHRYSNRMLVADTATTAPNYPEPKSVLYKSMIIPGWGQVVNNQVWKVPIIYGLISGLTWYTINLTKKYHDYQAAFYNLNNEDFKFGSTPPELEGQSAESLKFSRDKFRNRRDLMYVVIGLAYALNFVDAYVYAHMRSFDVSDDLSLRTTMKPDLVGEGRPGLTLSVELFRNKKAR